MYNRKIYFLFTIYILALICAIVYGDKQDDINIISNFEYIPKKGYLITMDDFMNYNLDDIVKEIKKNKIEEVPNKKTLNTITIKTPNIWLEKWGKTDKDLQKRYRQTMPVPNPNNNETVYQLLVMSRNAYVKEREDDWVDITDYGWEIFLPFGWSDDNNDRTANNVRGYIFINENSKILVVSIKGTSAGLFGIGGPTAENDKYNDNMMFSCCCAIVDRTWRGICGCHSGITNTCENKCLRDESRSYKNSYYEQLKPIINSVEEKRKEGYEVFFTGHSLGGALASLSGLSMMAPVMTFESPGEAQFAERLGLIKRSIENYKNSYNNLPIYHFGNNGDPIYLGKCTGITSACYYSGFAMETKCHVGKLYMFDLDKNINNPDEPDEPDDDNDNPDDNNDSPIGNDPGNNNIIKSTSSKPKHRVFLNNKSSIYEHQLIMKRSQLSENENVDSSFTAPSNPSKLNMLHHRVDYVINLIKKWAGPWPTEFYQDDCRDCENWRFMEGDGDEGRVHPP
jgi:putative lipase involved disintegration of autophagic bodies